MCSNQGDCNSDNPRHTKLTHRRDVCVKCSGANGPPAILVRSDDPALCKLCFLNACLHKFKSSFGKSNVIPKDSKVAVGISGGVSSTVMLDLLKKYTNCRFKPLLFHVLEPNGSEMEIQKITELLNGSGFTFHMFEPSKVCPKIHTLHQLIHSQVRTSTAVLKNSSNLLKWCKQQLLVQCARLLSCDWLLLGSHGTHLANDFLMGIIEGRSGFSAADASFIDGRYGDVTLARPLHAFMAKELVFYSRFCQLESLSPNDPTTETILKRPTLTTLHRLCDDFLAGLQGQGFPSTTQTILSTSSKLLTNPKEEGECQRCRLCWAPVPLSRTSPDPNKLAMSSLHFSYSITSSDNAGGQTTFVKHLCYACTAIYVELPQEIQSCFDQTFFENPAYS